MVVGEELECEREPRNHHDTFAVTVKKGSLIVGHIPRCISHICSMYVPKKRG